VELDRAFRKVQFGSDFFIGETTKNPVEDLFFAASQLNTGFDAVARVEQFLGLRIEVSEILRSGRDHDEVIAGGLAANHAMHGKQTSGMVDGEFPIGSCVDMKVCRTGCLLIEQVDTG